MKVGGVLRVVVAAGVGVGLVFGAGHANGVVRVTQPGDRPAVGSAPATTLDRASVTCPGPDHAQQVSVLATSAPAPVLAPFLQPVPRSGAAGGVQGTLLPGGGASTSAPLKSASNGLSKTQLVGDRAIEVATSGRLAPGSSVAQYSAEETPAARGASLLQCTPPTRDGWLIAGGEQPGRLTRLVLSNPGTSAVTAAVTVLTSVGRDPSSVEGVVIGPTQRVVLTIARPRTGTDPAIHVTSSGGPVSISATDVWRDGETPVGEDTTGTAAKPARTQVLPAVTVVGPPPAVRVANPGVLEAVVRVRVTGSDGSIAMEKLLTVAAGRTGSAELTGLPAGQYSVQVLSDEPVVAAASVRTSLKGPGDLSWAAAAPAVTTVTGLALPTGVTATLGVTAVGRPAQIILTSVDGQGKLTTVSRSINAGKPVLEPLPGAQSVWMSVRSGAVYAALSVSGKSAKGALLAATALAPLPLRSQASTFTPAIR